MVASRGLNAISTPINPTNVIALRVNAVKMCNTCSGPVVAVRGGLKLHQHNSNYTLVWNWPPRTRVNVTLWIMTAYKQMLRWDIKGVVRCHDGDRLPVQSHIV